MASALLAAALAVAAAGRGCSADDDSPAGVVAALVEATRAGDQTAVYELLGPRTRASLEQQARRATELVGGDRRYRPVEMLALGPPPDDAVAPHIDVVSQEDERAVVQLDQGGGKARLDVVLIDGRWRVELAPAPAGP